MSKMIPQKGKPKVVSAEIKELFDGIAPKYDFLNRLNSLGLDLKWRQHMIDVVAKESPSQILDLAAGTGDVTLALAKSNKESFIIGADLSKEMLEIGRKKLAESNLFADRISFQEVNALAMPFEDNTFDAVTCAFGIRNFESIPTGLNEILRVLRPNGICAILELCRPSNGFLRWGYDLYAHHIIPSVAHLFAAKPDAYRYLARSIEYVPNRDGMIQLMHLSGFERCEYRVFFPQVCALYVAYKPFDSRGVTSHTK